MSIGNRAIFHPAAEKSPGSKSRRIHYLIMCNALERIRLKQPRRQLSTLPPRLLLLVLGLLGGSTLIGHFGRAVRFIGRIHKMHQLLTGDGFLHQQELGNLI